MDLSDDLVRGFLQDNPAVGDDLMADGLASTLESAVSAIEGSDKNSCFRQAGHIEEVFLDAEQEKNGAEYKSVCEFLKTKNSTHFVRELKK